MNAESLLLHGFAAYSADTAEQAASCGVPVVIDTGSAHIRVQEKLVTDAYTEAGVRPRSFPASWVERQLHEYELADRILVGSSMAARSFAGTDVAEKVRVARYGTDLDAFHPKRRYAPNDVLVVAFVGNINPEKGIDALADAVGMLGDAVVLRVVGRVPPELKRWWAKQRPTVSSHVPHLAGNAIADFYRGIDLLVLPSRQDGFGLVVLEAMACGTPCVVSRGAGSADLISDKVNGRIVPPGDAYAIASAIAWFNEDRARIEGCGRAAVQTALSQTLRAYVDSVESVYEELDE
jgi:glycosyltransferase involved in cell wall biosynthesis